MASFNYISSASASVLTLFLLSCHLSSGAASKDITVVGDRFNHPKAPEEYLQTYVRLPKDHTSQTPPLAVGIELTEGFIRKVDKLPVSLSVQIPTGPGTTFNYTAHEQAATFFPMVGKNPFVFAYWSYGFNGHPPVGVYDVPHFDFHFMFPSFEDWWGKEWTPSSFGPCMGGNNETFFKSFKPIPAACWPGKTSGPVTQVGDFVWGMGSHLFDFSSPEFNPQRHFNFTQIYGQYNGEIAYFEPMIALSTMNNRAGYKECRALVNNPLAMSKARLLPGQLCLERKARSFVVEYRNFNPVPAGCSAARGYAGGFPASSPRPPANLCTVPPVPSAAP